MKITEVNLTPAGGGFTEGKKENSRENVRAFVNLCFDNEFAVRNLKIISGAKGLFISMPTRQITYHCPRCKNKNHLLAKFCNECGISLSPDDQLKSGNIKIYAEICHPINSGCRQMINEVVLAEYDCLHRSHQEPSRL